ncbi:leucine-rich repeat domain-containing protein [Flavobacterium defluvii]|uniref:Leucine rich repeat-containing protein n=1 Tax=Flavobacterium defluvii TaxID=370979 RepID=A0A1M5RMS1_9FLAO|nr:leucine-rich repeat domain-containing protein [Flavobacterium defluvii]SHH27617.1 Leucine rich repeat-containing protein [Flavobacterium defluvii]
MGSLLQNTIFGNNKYKANTFIGGVATTLNTPALIASKLGLPIARIKSFTIVQDDIQFAVIGGSYTIAPNAFSNQNSLTYFNDAAGLVKQINSQAFFNCINAVNYNFPNVEVIIGDLTVAAKGTFAFNTSLTTFSAPSLITIKSTYTFHNCTSLINFHAPLLINFESTSYTFNSCTKLTTLTTGILNSLGQSDFANCVNLASTFDLSNLLLVPNYAFFNCEKIPSFGILKSADTIGIRSFFGCKSITSFSAPRVSYINQSAFHKCSGVTEYNFPEVITIEGDGSNNGFGTFQENIAMTSFIAPKLTTITKSYTFTNNIALRTFYAPQLVNLTATNATFSGCTELANLTIGSLNSLGQYDFANCINLISSFDLSKVLSIPNYVFLNCRKIPDFGILKLTKSIGIRAFSGCWSVTSFITPEVTYINEAAFYDCKRVIEYDFPNVTIIEGENSNNGFGTFQGNTSMISFIAPKLTTITKTYAFANNSALKTFYAPLCTQFGTLDGYSYCFYNCNNLSDFTVGATTSIGINAFTNCQSITYIDLSLVTSLYDGAFENCVKLISINNLNNVTTIKQNAFNNCKSLTTFSGNQVKYIGSRAFLNCSSVTSYNFPELETITGDISTNGFGTFKSNTMLTSFTAPKLTKIEYWDAFSNCTNIESIYLPVLITLGSTTANNNNFFNIKKGCTITVSSLLKTVNSGQPDGDLVYASTTREAIVNYI